MRNDDDIRREAQQVMLRWLREAAAEVGGDQWARLGDVAWRSNRDGPHYGVWADYPICARNRP